MNATLCATGVSTLLVVDDDSTILEMLQVLLEQESYRVLTATDGEEGLRVAQDRRPDLILSDMMMPRMGGLEMIARLRDAADTRKVPIILISSATPPYDQAPNWDSFWNKTSDFDKLLAEIKRHLPRRAAD